MLWSTGLQVPLLANPTIEGTQSNEIFSPSSLLVVLENLVFPALETTVIS